MRIFFVGVPLSLGCGRPGPSSAWIHFWAIILVMHSWTNLWYTSLEDLADFRFTFH